MKPTWKNQKPTKLFTVPARLLSVIVAVWWEKQYRAAKKEKRKNQNKNHLHPKATTKGRVHLGCIVVEGGDCVGESVLLGPKSPIHLFQPTDHTTQLVAHIRDNFHASTFLTVPRA